MASRRANSLAAFQLAACAAVEEARAAPRKNSQAVPEPKQQPQVLVPPGGLPGRCGRLRMDGIIYLVGLVVIVMAILSFLGLR